MRSPEHRFLSTPPLASSDASQPSTGHGVLVRVSFPIHRIHGPPPGSFPRGLSAFCRRCQAISSVPLSLVSLTLSVNSPFRQSHVLEPFQFCPVRWRPSVFTFGFSPKGPSVLSCVAFMAPFPAFCDASQYSLAIHYTLYSSLSMQQYGAHLRLHISTAQ